ncbi:type 1 glutamine amidotransferase [uncultured Lactobacillus sp.]|uniref:type 1 glutamine amidotransferase n=1 Tax=uncultured Lactobacillus sp. TaxID=153152 RepID=UPI002803C4AB|nr:type 1 glutamine amidotransferase [uncultured Lactobacillus sp.]
MRINVLQHTPNEGPGSIEKWADQQHAEFYVYHPATFGKLPTAEETDMLIILGGPMSPNDDFPWIHQERQLIKELAKEHKPMFGACFGAQQISKAFGGTISDAKYKEVGWAPVYLKDKQIAGIPDKLTALHWHQQMFSIPEGGKLLFSSDLLENQGFILGDNIVGLQFHFEPLENNLREIAINDGGYADDNNALKQDASEIIAHGVPKENEKVMFTILDYISKN